jgi:hypothetical protein
VTTRPLDPAEIYYEVVDRLWPMNSLLFVTVTDTFDRAQVEQAWSKLVEQVPTLGARVVRTDPRTASIDFSAGLTGSVTEFTDVPSMLVDLLGTRLHLAGPLARCGLAPGLDGGTTFAIAASHAALDGRSLAQVVLLMARVLVDGANISGHPLTQPTEPLSRFALPERDWSTRRSEMLATARSIRDEAEFAGNGSVPGWYRTDAGDDRDLACAVFTLTPDESRSLIGWSKTSGATVHGALSVAMLRTLARLSPGSTRFPLSTVVDLRVRADPAAIDVVGQAAAVVAGSFDATTEAAELARQVTRDIGRRVERGEPELFFALSGVERLPVGETTDKIVRQWMAASTPAANFSNLGVVTGEAPDNVRGVGAILAPTPNQVVFVATTTFRGHVTFALCFDRNRLSIEPSEFTDALRAEVAALCG